MKSTKSSINHVTIDGQKLLFLAKEDWEDLKVNPILDDISVFCMESIIERELSTADRYPEIYVGLGFSSPHSNKWTSYTFLKTGEHFQRIFLEKLTCTNCSWQAMTANPLNIDSYLADGLTPDKFTLMRYAADRYPVIKCPQCDSSLPRYPIWIAS